MKLILYALVSLPLAAQNYFSSASAERARIPSGGIHFSSDDQFHGSVATEGAETGTLRLSLQEAIDRGIKNNLGLLVRGSESSAARSDRLRALSALLPTLSGGIAETISQISLETYGFHFAGFPSVNGPFSYTDVRAYANQSVFNWTSLKNLKSAAESARAAQLSLEDGRDLVVQAVASGYLAVLASAASAEVARVQIRTAEVLYEGARDRHTAGVSPAIDELRAQVELKTQQQRLAGLENQVAREKLALGRVIGLPLGQAFDLTDQVPYAALEGVRVEDLLKKALDTRPDYRSGEAQVRAAELARQAAGAQRYPTVAVSGNYGDIGRTLSQSHGTFTVTGSLNFNIFDGGRIRADEMAAETEAARRKNELADLRGKIDFEVRTAILDLSTAADQVTLARANLDLATQTLDQARDRVAAGVVSNLELVQAQESISAANQSLINSQYTHNLAKVSLARAVGGAESALKQLLGNR